MPASSILAATIVFSGLILHVQTDRTTNAKRAVFVDARPSHNPMLIVPIRDAEHTGTWTFVDTTNQRKYDLAGRHLEFVGSSDNTVEDQPKFADFAVHLPTVLPRTDELSAALTNRSPSTVATGATTYLDYAGGTLDVPVCHIAAAQYAGLPPRCVAREVAFTPRVPGRWSIRDVVTGDEITFRRNAIVQVQNDTFPPVRGQQHQKHYAQLLTGGTEVPDLRESDLMCTPACRLIGILPRRGLSVECTNNQWP